MAGKSFKVSGKKKPPIEFSIEVPVIDPESGDVKLAEDGTEEYKTENFHARPKIPGALLLDLASAGTVGDAYQASSMRRFFDYAVIPADKERWYATIESEEAPVELDMLGEIMSFLMAEYTDRPTESASS